MVTLNNTGNVQTEKDLDGFTPTPAGRYHTVITNADEKLEQCDAVVLDLQLKSGTEPAGFGKIHQERFYLTSEAGQRRLLKLGLTLGLITWEQHQAAKAQGIALDIPFAGAVGRQLVIDIVPHEYKKKDRETNQLVLDENGKQVMVSTTQMAFNGFHAVGSKGAEGVPLDPELAALLTAPAPAQQSSAQQATTPAQQAPAQQAPAQQAPAQQAPAQQLSAATAAGNGNGNGNAAAAPAGNWNNF
jgi:hypothetical protein